MPVVVAGELRLEASNQAAIEDILYRLEEQLVDMAEFEGRQVPAAGRLAAKIRAAG